MEYFIVLCCLILSPCSWGIDKEKCTLEMSFVPFFFQNGADLPDKLKEAAKSAATEALKNGADWIADAESTLGSYLKGMGFYLTAISYVNTNNLTFHMGIVCTYRFVHNNKIISDFEVRQVPRIWSDSDRDWFELREFDLSAQKIKEKIEEMKKECSNHENN